MKQPRPIPNNHRASWGVVLRDLEKAYQGPVATIVRDDICERDYVGEQKYGTRLQPFNGRDSLLDAYEEALDLTVYLKNAHTEGSPVYMLYREALRMAVSIRELLYKRDGR
jgi:hypothetical protein